MTTTIAITGKSGSGKTTLTKNFLKLLQEYHPDKSILLFDNDLSGELGHTFGLDVRNTIYGIRSGKHEYKTGIPSRMTKQEYIEWALEDILVEVDENVDLLVSWLVPSKDCRCPITQQISDAVTKLINRYDFVIFDCEFDLKYLNQLVDMEIDLTIIATQTTVESIHLAKRIEEFNAKYAAGGQMGVVLNMVKGNETAHLYELLQRFNLETLGVIPYDEELKNDISRNSDIVSDAIRQFYFRLNLPQLRI
ncbi:AAA family ATPase [bacterium]|nr:AAA family ATPase [bacterium]